MTGANGAALIVGGSGALGARIVAMLADRGHAVVATSTSGTATGPDAAKHARWVRFDARDGGSGTAELAQAVDEGGPLGVLVYAAGAGSSKSPLALTSWSESVELLTVNAAGLHAVWRAVHPAARAGAARVVVISSQAAVTCTPGNGPYSASKAALEAVALTLAREEAAHGVRVNVVSPSLIDSPMAERLLALKGVTDIEGYYRQLPWGRALSIGEVAATVVALACDPAWQYSSAQVVRLGADIPATTPTRGHA